VLIRRHCTVRSIFRVVYKTE